MQYDFYKQLPDGTEREIQRFEIRELLEANGIDYAKSIKAMVSEDAEIIKLLDGTEIWAEEAISSKDKKTLGISEESRV